MAIALLLGHQIRDERPGAGDRMRQVPWISRHENIAALSMLDLLYVSWSRLKIQQDPTQHSTRFRAMGRTASTPCKGSRITPAILAACIVVACVAGCTTTTAMTMTATILLLRNSHFYTIPTNYCILLLLLLLLRRTGPREQSRSNSFEIPLECQDPLMGHAPRNAWVATGRCSIRLPRPHDDSWETGRTTINEAFPAERTR